MTDAYPRRTFLAAAGGLGLAAALAALPEGLGRRGWLDEAAGAQLDLTRDTINGLVAFVTPGDDAYSVAQEVSTRGPGGLAAGTTEALISLLDGLLPAPLVSNYARANVPASGLVAQALNGYALQVDPVASRGGFPSPFSRLGFDEKVEVFRRLESDTMWEDTPVRYLGGVLIAVVSLVAFSDATRRAGGAGNREPLGWELTGYGGVSDGWDEFKGYWRGHRGATRAHRALRGHHRRRRRRRHRRG